MSIKEVSAERLAQLFHLYHEALAGDFSGSRNDALWNEVAPQERRRMIAAARLALLDLGFEAKEREMPRPYFAAAGTAEWGC